MAHALAALWGLAESTLFFVLPEVLLSLWAITAPRRALWLAGAVVAGATVGAMGMFLWGDADPVPVRVLLTWQPGIDEATVDRASLLLRQQGLWGVVLGPWLGIPHKLLAVEAGYGIHGLGPYLLAFVPARALPALLAVGLGAALGWLRGRLALRAQALRVLLGIGWAVLHLALFL